MQVFDNIWNHPRTSAMGLLLGVVTVAGTLSQQGITLGHAGTGTVISLVSGLATALLGLMAHDPGEGGSTPGGTAKLGAWMLIALLLLPGMAGCSNANVAQQIVNWTPVLDVAVAAVNGSLAALDPTDAVALTQATQQFDASAKALEAQAKAYLANQGASELSKLQAAVVALEQQVNASLLEAAKIKNPESQQKALLTINAVGVAVLAILTLVQTVSNRQQKAAMAAAAPVKLADVAGWLNHEEAAAMVAEHYGVSRTEARMQVAQVEEDAMVAGF